jgi:hypothetical protein
MAGWPDGRMAGWPDGRMAGWPDGQTRSRLTLRASTYRSEETRSELCRVIPEGFELTVGGRRQDVDVTRDEQRVSKLAQRSESHIEEVPELLGGAPRGTFGDVCRSRDYRPSRLRDESVSLVRWPV